MAFFTTTNSSSMSVPLSTNPGMWACMLVNQRMILCLWSIHRHQLLQHEHRHQLHNPRQYLLLPDQDQPLQHCPIEHSLLWQGRGECSYIGHQGQVTFEPEFGSANRPPKEIFPVLQKELEFVKNHQQHAGMTTSFPVLRMAFYPTMVEMYISFYFPEKVTSIPAISPIV